ncbi:MAG: InlB B-repeat-containing protein, partial [Clostridia bacterium]|nr:InlB B-repeat-containing protein [Clostridia bacterium]
GTLSSLGLALYNDADFSGTGYTVAAYGSATHNRKDDTTNPLESGYSLEVVTTGTGGFKQEIPSAVDQVFYQVMVVKLPAGYNLQADTTGLGTGAASYWYDFTTNTWATGNGNWNSGTGDWKVYIHKAVCGSDGTFDTAGNVYVNDSTTWYVGYCQTYQVYAGTSSDIVSGNPLGTQLYQFGSQGTLLKALWQKKDITLTINPTGGTWGGSSAKTTITQNFGTSATIEDPVRAGYSFLGWIPTQTKNTDSGSGYTNDTWAQVFHHNNANGSVLFSSSDNLASTTINEANKFSLLNKLDVIKTSSSGWEFLLEYPDQSSGRYNRWVQSSNPATTAEGNATQSTGIQAEAPDYVPKHIDWDENYWGGLGLSTSGSTFIDGSYGHGDWFYAIGSYASDGIGIPSYSSTGGVSQLWVKLPSSDVNALGITTSFKDADALGNNNTFWFNDCNITLQAVWKVNDYTVTADAQGGEIPATTGWTLGTGSTTATKLITYNTSYGTLPTPKKSGFKFEGWSLTSELPELEEGELPQYLTDTSIMTTAANHTIYAIYSIATFEITLDDGAGNTQTVMVTCDETEDITSTTTPTKTGYTFNGYENSEGTRVVDENKNFIPDIDGWTNPDGTWARYESCTLTALWKPIDYTVTLKVDTGDSTKDITVKVTYGTSNFEPAVTAVSRTGYEFLGWYKGISSTSELIINKDCVLQETSPYTEDGKWNYPGNVILNAVWKPETYTITLDNTTNGGTGGTTSVSATYESTFEFPGIQCPTKTGYEFEGWFTAETGGLKVIGTDGKLQESVSGY